MQHQLRLMVAMADGDNTKYNDDDRGIAVATTFGVMKERRDNPEGTNYN
jgi:hypothetical protein